MIQPTPPVRAPRWMKITLGLSLALNLLVAGMVGGAVLGRGHDRHDGLRSERFTSGDALVRALSPDDRRAVRRALGPRGKTFAAQRAQMATASDRMVALLRSTPFDAAAFGDAIDARARLGADLADAGQAALIAQIATLSQAQRNAYADRLEAMAQNNRRRGKPAG
jgi:uncharacterized membrane protein